MHQRNCLSLLRTTPVGNGNDWLLSVTWTYFSSGPLSYLSHCTVAGTVVEVFLLVPDSSLFRCTVLPFSVRSALYVQYSDILYTHSLKYRLLTHAHAWVSCMIHDLFIALALCRRCHTHFGTSAWLGYVHRVNRTWPLTVQCTDYSIAL